MSLAAAAAAAAASAATMTVVTPLPDNNRGAAGASDKTVSKEVVFDIIRSSKSITMYNSKDKSETVIPVSSFDLYTKPSTPQSKFTQSDFSYGMWGVSTLDRFQANVKSAITTVDRIVRRNSTGTDITVKVFAFAPLPVRPGLSIFKETGLYIEDGEKVQFNLHGHEMTLMSWSYNSIPATHLKLRLHLPTFYNVQ